jgi:hypothetical protein
LEVTATGPAASGSFEIIPTSLPVYYSITTDATYSGTIQLCIEYDDTDIPDEDSLAIWHWDGFSWSALPITSLDTDSNLICAETYSLSPFVVAIPGPYICGDVDSSTAVNVADLTYLVDYLFFGGSAPPILEAANVDGSGGINVADLTYLVDYLFFGGPQPVCEPIE